jgi:hypothetical protein
MTGAVPKLLRTAFTLMRAPCEALAIMAADSPSAHRRIERVMSDLLTKRPI